MVIEMSANEGKMEGNREELKELLEGIKKAVIELRSALDEIMNPVVPPQIVQRPPPTSKSVAPSSEPSPQKTEASQEKPAMTKVEVPGLEEVQREVDRVVKELEYPQAPGPRRVEFGLDRLAGLLRLVYELQAQVPAEYLGGLADILHKSGLIDEAQRDTLSRIIELARIGYDHGLSVDESIAILAALAKELGLDVAEITEELVKAIIRRRGATGWESQQQ